MIKIKQLHYEFKQEIDKVDTLSMPDFLPHQVDIYLNKGIRSWFKDQYDRFGDGRGFETSEKQIEKLADFHVLSPQLQEPIIPIALDNGLYEVNLGDLKYELAYITKIVVSIAKDGCETENRRAIFYRTNDISNFYKKSSWKWKMVYYTVGKSNSSGANFTNTNKSIYIDTANEFEVSSVYISYLRWPVEVYYGGYNHINEQASYQSPNPPIDSDVDYFYKDNIITYAVEQAKIDMGDPAWQLSRNKIELNK